MTNKLSCTPRGCRDWCSSRVHAVRCETNTAITHRSWKQNAADQSRGPLEHQNIGGLVVSCSGAERYAAERFPSWRGLAV